MYDSRLPINHNMLIMARMLRGLSLEEVAAQSGIALDTLTQYEAQSMALNPVHLKVLATGYDFPPSFFFREGELHLTGHVCYRHDAYDELLEPLQALLDKCVGDEVIMEVEWRDDGIYLRQFETDEDKRAFAQEKLGNTVREAGTQLRRLLRQEGLLRK